MSARDNSVKSVFPILSHSRGQLSAWFWTQWCLHPMSVLRALKLPTALWISLGGWKLNSGLNCWFLCVIQTNNQGSLWRWWRHSLYKYLGKSQGATDERIVHFRFIRTFILQTSPLYVMLGLEPRALCIPGKILPPSCHPIQALTSTGTRFESSQKLPSSSNVKSDPQGWLV